VSRQTEGEAAAEDPQNERDRDRDWRSLLFFLVILLLGFVCLMLTAQMAVRPDRMWQIPAGMLSQLNPDEDTDTGERRVEPLRPEVLTPPPWDPNFLTPEGTAVVVAPATFVPVRPGTPTPGEVAFVPTPSPSATAFTPTPTQTPTPTGTPTPTPTSTPTATPTTTSTPTTTPSSTPTATSMPTPTTEPPPQPTRPSSTPTHTPTATPTTVPPPSILSITPNWGVNLAPVPVVIRGSNFYGMPTARLGASVPIAISAATTDTLTGTVPAGITPGVYALVVQNPDGQSAILSPAYTALAPATTLETGDVVTFGTAGTSPGNGDNDQVQVIFLTVPNTITDTLYVHIFDPDVGGGTAFDERQTGVWDTATTFSLYGGDDAYDTPAAQQATFAPSDPGISSGTLITSQTFAEDASLDGTWYTFATVNPNQGEAAGGRYVFKLSVIGANSGDDGNRYNVALSTSPTGNEPPTGSRIFAYSWTFPLYASSTKRLYSYVPSGTLLFAQHNWDMDGASGTMTLLTPIRSIPVPSSDISGGGVGASTDYRLDANEDGATWTVTMSFTPAGPWDDLTFWAEDGAGTALAIFTQPTTASPP
jgi:hypothetical protein